MLNELPIGQRVVHQTDSRWTGRVIDRIKTTRTNGQPGPGIVVVLFDGQSEPRMMDVSVMLAA